MKNIIINLLTLACGINALYEQSKPEPNKFILFGCFIVFMIGIYRIMKRIPSKHDQDAAREFYRESLRNEEEREEDIILKSEENQYKNES